MRDFPALNAWYGGGIHQIQERIHIGMATALDDGLVVPVIRDADRMTLADLGQSIRLWLIKLEKVHFHLTYIVVLLSQLRT